MAEKFRAHPPKFFKEKFRRAHIFISGKVQGVYFRETMWEKAREFSVLGWVKNLTDGRVEAVIEGEKAKAEKLIEWAKRGPFLARVENLEVNWEKPGNGFNDFKVILE